VERETRKLECILLYVMPFKFIFVRYS